MDQAFVIVVCTLCIILTDYHHRHLCLLTRPNDLVPPYLRIQLLSALRILTSRHAVTHRERHNALTQAKEANRRAGLSYLSQILHYTSNARQHQTRVVRSLSSFAETSSKSRWCREQVYTTKAPIHCLVWLLSYPASRYC